MVFNNISPYLSSLSSTCSIRKSLCFGSPTGRLAKTMR
ncbi:hypothetical protein J560_3615 [Acinetobacter baumannii 855125]|nr:hypothetical protein J560_3615 [Acinetobacter baumannii 855125]